MAELTVQHDKTNVRGMTDIEIAIRAANAIEKATKKIETEAARESCRQTESHHGSYIYLGDTLHPDNLPTLGALLGLPNRAGTPLEEDLGLAGLLYLPRALKTSQTLSHPRQVPLNLTGRSVCCL
jgi:hypothetical protein